MKPILVLDSQSSGHHFEYISHVFDWFSRIGHPLILCVCEKVANELPKVTANITINVIPGSGGVLDRQQASYEANHAFELAQVNDVSTICFLSINPYQLEVMRWATRSVPFKIRGILFGPPHRMSPHASSTAKEKTRLRLTRLRKYLQLYLLCANPHVSDIFVLDDSDGVNNMGFPAKGVVKSLPDPIMTSNAPSASVDLPWFDALQPYKIFLIFGSLAPRKNVINSIEGFIRGADADDKLVIAGKGSPAYLKKIKDTIAKLPADDAQKIVFRPGFLTQEEMNYVFYKADVIMMVYRHFFGSSGILGNAARWGKPVLTGNAGLVHTLVHRHHLGISVEPTVEGIASGVSAIGNSDYLERFSPDAAYLRGKTVERFAETLFNSID